MKVTIDNEIKIDRAYYLFADAEEEIRKGNFKRAEQLKNRFSLIYDKLSENDKEEVRNRLDCSGM